MNRSASVLLLAFFIAAPAWGGVPTEINHQGVVSVDDARFDGTGLFRFAIVDPDTGMNLWSNDGSITGAVGGIPTAAVSLTVTNGVYSVGLGDTGLPNMTVGVSPSVFNDNNARLRIWFDDGVNGNQQLTPDHKLTTAPYSARLPNVFVNDSGNVGIRGTPPPFAFPTFQLDVAGGARFWPFLAVGTGILPNASKLSIKASGGEDIGKTHLLVESSVSQPGETPSVWFRDVNNGVHPVFQVSKRPPQP